MIDVTDRVVYCWRHLKVHKAWYLLNAHARGRGGYRKSAAGGISSGFPLGGAAWRVALCVLVFNAVVSGEILARTKIQEV